ncbi:MAG: hypothetical protein R3A52_24600 [Polyangiales bacterium]
MIAPALPVAAPAAPSATLRVSTIPYAMVSVDGSPFAGSPRSYELPAGEHVVTARFAGDGGEAIVRQRTVTLRAGETQSVGVTP